MEEPSDVWTALERTYGDSKEDPASIISNDKPEPLLRIRTANQCVQDAKAKPVPQMLFAELWHEGELCILFADTNIGKSIATVQIGDNISRNHSPPAFPMQARGQPVLYLDFELSDKQFQQRYSVNFEREYRFDNNFYRVEINPNFSDFDNFEKALLKAIEEAIIHTEARVMIVDNLTYLKTQATDTAKEALPLMKFLKDLKNRYGMSILALAHTPKRDNTRPLTVNDLAGSKHLSNFADSIFAIGQSEKDSELRYFKQIKTRATAKIYDSDNVIVCRLTKPYNFLGFEFEGYSYERDHLRVRSDNEHEELDAKIKALKESKPELSNASIAKELGTNKMKVGRALNRNKPDQSTNTQ